MSDQKESLETTLESLQTTLFQFFKHLTSIDTFCNNCKKKFYDQLPLSLVDSQTFINIILTSDKNLVIVRCSTNRNTLIPTVIQEMEKRFPPVCLTGLWTN